MVLAIVVASGLSGGCAAGGGSGQGQVIETVVPLGELPPAVAQGLARHAPPGFEVQQALRRYFADRSVISCQGPVVSPSQSPWQAVLVLATTDGELVAMGRQVTPDELPDLVVMAFRKRYRTATMIEARSYDVLGDSQVPRLCECMYRDEQRGRVRAMFMPNGVFLREER